MGGFLKVVGALALIIIVLLAALIGWGVMTVGPLIKDATVYSDQAVQAIAAQWDREELVKRASPELKANMTPEGLDNLYAVLTTFGPLVKADPSMCGVTGSITTQSGKTIVATCVAKAKCANADVQFKLALLRTGTSWAIGGIFVEKIILGTPTAPGVSFGAGSLDPARGVRMPLTWLGSVGRSKH